MLLAVDVGNTNIVIGLSRNGKWIQTWRMETGKLQSQKTFGIQPVDLFERNNVDPREVETVIVSSVVPEVTAILLQMIRDQTGREPLLLTDGLDTGIRLDTENPAEVGADLIADAAGAYHRFREDCLIVDLGTATTLIAVTEPGVLTGGAICIGMEISLEALVGKASRLSEIPLEVPDEILGRNTRTAMQSGVVWGHLLMIEGMIEKIRETVGPAKVIATGGLSEKLAKHTDLFDVVDPMLTLNGLRIIAERQ